MKKILYKSCAWSFFIFSFFVVDARSSNADSVLVDSLNKVLLQQKDDTGKATTFNELSSAYLQQNNFGHAMQNATSALALSEKINFGRGAFTAYLNMGFAIHIRKDQAAELDSYTKALSIAMKTGDKQEMIYAYLCIQEMYLDFDNYAEALTNAFESQKIREQTLDKNTIAIGLVEIGKIYSALKNNAEVLKYNLSALKIFGETTNKQYLYICYFDIGDIYYGAGNYPEALKNYSEAFKILQELKGEASPYGIAFYYGAIADVYSKQAELENDKGNKTNSLGKYNEALKNYMACLDMYKSLASKQSIASTVLSIGQLYMKLGNLTAAKKYLESSRSIYRSIGYKRGLLLAYSSLSSLDSLEGNYKNAYQNFKASILYRDSINLEENSKKASQIQMQQEYEIKQAIAKAEQDKKDADAKRIKNNQYFIISTLGVLVMVALIITLIQFRYNKQKQKANLLLAQQKLKVENTLSELKSTQAQLIQSEKMASLGELTAGIAHEIQNPLNFVNNFSEVNNELIKELEEAAGSEQRDSSNEADILTNIKENSEKINHHGKRADAIVKSMLQHSRGAESANKKELTDINALADEYFRLAYHGFKAKDNTFNSKIDSYFDPTIGTINIIPQEIGRVLLNLINNAFYAVNEKKKMLGESFDPLVSVTTIKLKDRVEIKVKDNGSGIPQNILNKIFQPFFTTKPTGLGTGLGLSLAHDIAKAHDGTLSVTSRQGEGTEFVLQLPSKTIQL